MGAGSLSCITHGDSWTMNIMFRYDDGNRPTDALLIDWQIARLGHPSVDLCYFLFSSTSSAFRHEHLDGLLIEYFSILKCSLFKLGIDLGKEGYDRDRFMRESKERYVLSLFMALFIMPILLDADANKETNDAENHQKTADDPQRIQLTRNEEGIYCFLIKTNPRGDIFSLILPASVMNVCTFMKVMKTYCWKTTRIPVGNFLALKRSSLILF